MYLGPQTERGSGFKANLLNTTSGLYFPSLVHPGGWSICMGSKETSPKFALQEQGNKQRGTENFDIHTCNISPAESRVMRILVGGVKKCTQGKGINHQRAYWRLKFQHFHAEYSQRHGNLTTYKSLRCSREGLLVFVVACGCLFLHRGIPT